MFSFKLCGIPIIKVNFNIKEVRGLYGNFNVDIANPPVDKCVERSIDFIVNPEKLDTRYK